MQKTLEGTWFLYNTTLEKNGKTIRIMNQRGFATLGNKPVDLITEWNRLATLNQKSNPENGLWHYELS